VVLFGVHLFTVDEKIEEMKVAAVSKIRLMNKRLKKKQAKTGERLLASLLEDDPCTRVTLEQLFWKE